MKKAETISEINTKKYMYPPSWEQIEQFLNELGITMYRFERFYHLPFNTLTQVKAGTRNLPATYWEIIYEKIKPTYGCGFLVEYTTKHSKNRINGCITKNLTNPSTEQGKHDRIVTLT